MKEKNKVVYSIKPIVTNILRIRTIITIFQIILHCNNLQFKSEKATLTTEPHYIPMILEN